jgi:hypothetical protein
MRISALFLALLFLSLNLKAGDDDPKRWKKGLVITFGGDTIRGRVKINDYLDINYDCQHTLAFKDSTGVTKYYFPESITSFFYYEGQDISSPLGMYESVSNPWGDGRVFLRAYCSGTCRVYGQTITELKGDRDRGDVMHAPLIPVEKKYIQVRGGNFVLLKRTGFKEAMKEIFAECPLIISRLESKAYTYGNWQEMVNDYNRGICK